MPRLRFHWYGTAPPPWGMMIFNFGNSLKTLDLSSSIAAEL
jgi:hypothetical protein